MTEPGGFVGVRRLAHRLLSLEDVRSADLIVTLVPQSDMALALTDMPWVAYLRGLPWPARGEAGLAKSVVWRVLENLALRRAREVWATTPLLARETGAVVNRLVPPGIASPDSSDGPADGSEMFVWAARYSADKDPQLFADALRGTSLGGVMYGSGPLEDELRAYAPSNVSVPGWADRGTLWREARAYVGTSTREAFGRSAVEAAMLGVPPVVSDAFGCAEMLYTDVTLRREMVVESRDPRAWQRVLLRLHQDDDLRTEASLHAQENARRLTIYASVAEVQAAADARMTR
ncbi:glycosyltransferase [Microbacterium sp. TS-1]|uniref:glycosyltransferase n=1 Tax=Microbacterium sp. TS-1 TaxID=1344956 RepID=UPI0009DD7AA5|nr:glycosyltransferase [Microbacterium sp. TS-1]